MEEKIRVNSRASVANRSRIASVDFVSPTSISRRNKRLSLASFRQIFTRIRKSFLLNASSASFQLAATDPDARTSCRTSSVLLIVLGNCFYERAHRLCEPECSLFQIAWLGTIFHLRLRIWFVICDLGVGIWNLAPQAAASLCLTNSARCEPSTSRRPPRRTLLQRLK